MRQLRKQVPAGCFLLTFTLPAQFRPLAFAHQTLVYDLLMRCAWETVRTFSSNDRQLQGIPGATAVLHTHTRRLDFHPHVHLLMPAAAIDGTGVDEKRIEGKPRDGKRKDGARKLWRTKRCAGTGAQLWVSAFELQAADRFAASGAEVRSGAGAGVVCLGQTSCAVPVLLLRGGDDDCADADSIFACGTVPVPVPPGMAGAR